MSRTDERTRRRLDFAAAHSEVHTPSASESVQQSDSESPFDFASDFAGGSASGSSHSDIVPLTSSSRQVELRPDSESKLETQSDSESFIFDSFFGDAGPGVPLDNPETKVTVLQQNSESLHSGNDSEPRRTPTDSHCVRLSDSRTCQWTYSKSARPRDGAGSCHIGGRGDSESDSDDSEYTTEYYPAPGDESDSESDDSENLESDSDSKSDSVESDSVVELQVERRANNRRKVKPTGVTRSPEKKRWSGNGLRRSKLRVPDSAADIEEKYNVTLQPNGQFHMSWNESESESDSESAAELPTLADSESDSNSDVDPVINAAIRKNMRLHLTPAPMKRALPGSIALVCATRFHAQVGSLYVIGGPSCTKQDVISTSCPPFKAKGVHVVIDRFQVRVSERRKGYGKQAMACLARLYKQAGALSLRVPAATSQGVKFYKKVGFIRNDMKDWVLNLQKHNPSRVRSEFKTPSPGPDPRPTRKVHRGDSDSNFDVTGKGYYRQVKCKTMNRVYAIPYRRLAKGMKKLNPTAISGGLLRPGNKQSCMCARKCPSRITVSEVLDAREEYFAQDTEKDAANFLVSKLRSMTKRDKKGTITYTHLAAGTEVCGQFYRAFIGVSRSKLTACRKVVASGGTKVTHGNQHKVTDSLTKYTICVSFWDHFFETAQRPNNECRLMPSNLPHQYIYDIIFAEWYKNLKKPGDSDERKYEDYNLPSFATFYR